MNKTTKGALAAGSAAAILLGGVGTLAYWTDEADVDGTSITSGHMKLDASDCVAADWTLDGGSVYTTQKLVPGDTLTKACDVTLNVAGAHLDQVDFDVTIPSDVTGAQALVDELSATASVGGGTADNVAVVEGANTLPVSITITWPYGTEDNDSNVLGGLTATLDAITVAVTQDHLADAN